MAGVGLQTEPSQRSAASTSQLQQGRSADPLSAGLSSHQAARHAQAISQQLTGTPQPGAVTPLSSHSAALQAQPSQAEEGIQADMRPTTANQMTDAQLLHSSSSSSESSESARHAALDAQTQATVQQPARPRVPRLALPLQPGRRPHAPAAPRPAARAAQAAAVPASQLQQGALSPPAEPSVPPSSSSRPASSSDRGKDSVRARKAAESALRHLAARRGRALSSPSASSTPCSDSAPSHGPHRSLPPASSEPRTPLHQTGSVSTSYAESWPGQTSVERDSELDALVSEVLARELQNLMDTMHQSVATSPTGTRTPSEAEVMHHLRGILPAALSSAGSSGADAQSLASAGGSASSIGHRVDEALLQVSKPCRSAACLLNSARSACFCVQGSALQI